MAKRDIDFNDTKGILDGIQKLKKFRTRLILILVSIVSVGIIIIMLIILFGSSIQNIIDQYNNLSGATEDSKQQFAFRNVKITYDERGKMNIEIVQGANESNGGLGGVGDSDPGTPDGDEDSGGGGSGGGNGGGSGGTNPPSPLDITDQDILDDIANGLYTAEDYQYLVALGGESSSYEGFYAVACCVRNRVNTNNSSYKSEVTKSGQFSGYNPSEVGNPRNDDVKKAAVAVLRGGSSTIGNCYFFLGRYNGWDMWAESDISEFYNVGGNVYFNGWGKVHNKSNAMQSGDILIWDDSADKWLYGPGSKYP